jgi:hypothetical protein
MHKWIDQRGRRGGSVSVSAYQARLLRGSLYLTGAAAIALASACASPGHAAAPANAVKVVADVAAPTGLSIKVSGSSAVVRWAAPKGQTAPLKDFELYLDQNKPITLAPTVTSRTITGLAAGSEHFVQIVAVTADNQSLPVGASFSIKFVAPPVAAPSPVAQVTTPAPAPTPQATTPALPAATPQPTSFPLTMTASEEGSSYSFDSGDSGGWSSGQQPSDDSSGECFNMGTIQCP